MRELADDLARLEALALGPRPLDESGRGVEELEVAVNDRQHVRAQHLHRRRVTVAERREVHLRDRRARDRLALEAREDLADRLPERAFDLGDREVGRERRHAVLQLRELVGDVRGQQVAARREHLAELDEDRPERLERAAQAHRARRAVAAEEIERARAPEPAAGRVAGERELVETEAERDPGDLR